MGTTVEEIRERFENNEDVCGRVISTLSLMANKTRFRILCVLAEGDFCVGEIVDAVQMGTPWNISQQLRIHTLAGVLEKTRDEQRIIYHLQDRRLAKLIKVLEREYA